MKNTTPAKKAAPVKQAAPVKKTAAAPTPAAATKAAAKKTATKTAASKTAASKTAASKTAASKTAASKAAASKTAASKAAASKTSASKTSATKTAASRAKQPAAAQALRVREDETPWTAKELAEVRASIEADVAHLREEIQVAEADLVGLMRDGGDGAGDDQADAGAMTFEREHEISVANNAREMLVQNLHALERLDDGTYGICESCGNPIGKLRLQAAPRATLCMPCKTKQERR